MSSECAAPPTARGGGGEFLDGPRGGDQLFPLRFIEVPEVSGTGRARRRNRRLTARVREANETIFGLNFLAGYGNAIGDATADEGGIDGGTGSRQGRSSAASNSLQAAAVSDIHDLVAEAPEMCQGGREASFRETLRGRAGYPADTAQGSLAPYQPSLLSVPTDVSAAPFARTIVSDKARSYLEGIERMMRPVEQSDLLDSLHGPIKP